VRSEGRAASGLWLSCDEDPALAGGAGVRAWLWLCCDQDPALAGGAGVRAWLWLCCDQDPALAGGAGVRAGSGLARDPIAQVRWRLMSQALGRLLAMSIDRRIATLAERQHGLISRDQAVAAGATAGQVRHRLANGRWRPVRRSVYAVNGTPPTWHQATLAVCLALGERCWLSHRTAARLWGLNLPGVRSRDTVEVLVPTGGQRTLDGVTCHRSGCVPSSHLTRRHHLPVTTLARTIVDCAPLLRPGDVAAVVDDAVRNHQLRIADLASTLVEGRRRHPLALRAVLAAWQDGHDAGGSRRELGVLRAIRRARLPAPVQQHRVAVDGTTRYLDFAYPDLLIGIEFDGFAEHGRIRSTFDDDRVRRNGLTLAGWMMLHVTSAMTEAEIVAWVARALALRSRSAS
jgi:hypothetical protein